MNPDLVIIRACDDGGVPTDQEFQSWAAGALAGAAGSCSLGIRVVAEKESAELNHRYRDRDHPTNVLSFPMDLPVELGRALESKPLGDLVICAGVVALEAQQQGKPEMNHWAHLTVHGILHLLGHGHENEEEAVAMEALEREILQGFGIPDPYRVS